MSEGTLPLNSKIFNSAELEGERRLCFVAMTRTKNKLYLSDAARNHLDYKCQPSRFIEEIGKENLQYIYNFDEQYEEKIKCKQLEIIKNIQTLDNKHVGDKLMHPVFGKGTITKVTDTTYDILFDSGTRTISKSFFDK